MIAPRGLVGANPLGNWAEIRCPAGQNSRPIGAAGIAWYRFVTKNLRTVNQFIERDLHQNSENFANSALPCDLK
jgi:hypothetical protein